MMSFILFFFRLFDYGFMLKKKILKVIDENDFKNSRCKD